MAPSEVLPKASAGPTTFDEALRAATPRVWVTPAIVGINVAVFVAMVASGVSPLSPATADIFKWGAVQGPATALGGEWWRTITAAFVHIGAVHLAFNMYAFFKVGTLAERIYGNVAYLTLYLAAAIAGSLASVVWSPLVVCAGASGAIFGVYGSMLAFSRTGHDALRLDLVELRQSLLAFVGYNLFYGLTTRGISNAAHLGGLVAGASAGWLLSRDLLNATAVRHARRRYSRAAVLVPAIAVFAWVAHYRVSILPFFQGVAAVNAGDFSRAAVLFQQACDGDDATGCFNLGLLRAKGQGVPKDETQEAALYQRACDGGVPAGCSNMGLLYASGNGVQKDDTRAAALYKRACDDGEVVSCFNLGGAYAEGRGVPKDLPKAATLYNRACDAGHAAGCGNLARHYSDGLGVRKDTARAAVLYTQACDGGETLGCAHLGWAYHEGDGVPKDEVRAAILFQQACVGGEMTSCANLGSAYDEGIGVPKDAVRAASLYKLACDGGIQPACSLLLSR